MKAVLHGDYLDTFKGKTKDGKPYVYSVVYSNGDSVRLYGVDLSNNTKYSSVEIPVNIYGKEISVRLAEDWFFVNRGER